MKPHTLTHCVCVFLLTLASASVRSPSAHAFEAAFKLLGFWKTHVPGLGSDSGLCFYVGKEGSQKPLTHANWSQSPSNPDLGLVKRSTKGCGVWLPRTRGEHPCGTGHAVSIPLSPWSLPVMLLLFQFCSKLKDARVLEREGTGRSSCLSSDRKARSKAHSEWLADSDQTGSWGFCPRCRSTSVGPRAPPFLAEV